MMHKIYIIILVLSIYGLVNNHAVGQRSNPFDIIITKNALAPDSSVLLGNSRSDILDSSSLVSRAPISQMAADSIIMGSSKDIMSNDSLVSSQSLVINASNPFNVKETGGRASENPKREATSDLQNKKNDLAEQTKPTLEPSTSWLSKLKPKKSESTGIDYSLNFIFWILMASLLILATVINLKRKSFLNLYRAITNDNYLKLLQREENNGSSFFFLLLYFLFFLNSALFIYQVLINKFEIKGYKVFLFLFVALLTIYLVRLIATFMIQVTFPLEKEAKQFNFTIIMFNIIVGLLLIPVNILTAYAPFGPNMIYIGLGIIILFYVLRQIRGLFIAARIKGLRYFHFFIYLCTFEVAPFFWVISFVKNWYSVS